MGGKTVRKLARITAFLLSIILVGVTIAPSVVMANENNSGTSYSGMSEEEKEWVDNHSTLVVGYYDNYLPYCATDDNGQAYGLVTDVFDAIIDVLELENKIQLEYKSYDSYTTMIMALHNGEVDVVFPVGGDSWNLKNDGIKATTSVVSTGMDLVFKGTYSNDLGNIIAVNVTNNMQRYYTTAVYPNAQIVECNSIKECLDAVMSGAADSTVLNGLRSNIITNNTAYSELNTLQLPETDERTMGVRKDDVVLLNILNRGIGQIGPNYGFFAAYKYIDNFRRYTWKDFFKDYYLAILGTAAIVFGIIIFVLYLYIRTINKAAKENEKQLNEITELNNKLEGGMNIIQSMSKVYFTSYLVFLDTDSFVELSSIQQVHDRIGLNGKAQKSLFIMSDTMVHEESREELHKFVDLSTINERLSDKDFITCDYIGNTSGWSQLYIIAGDRDENGDILTLFIAARLIHEEKRREEEQNKNLAQALEAAEQSNRSKTVFLSNMSHDIRTPMNAIIGFTSLAGSHIDDTGMVKEYLSKINIASEHLLSLINDVLDMSRIESGKVSVEENVVYLPNLINEIVSIVLPDVNNKHLELVVDTQDISHYDVVTDKLRLNQVFINILSNAIKFTPAGGKISVNVTEKPYISSSHACYKFSIKDNGIGMSEEFKEHIFEAFSREKTSTVSGIQGTGLGMAITKRIVDMLGGEIEVISEPGAGTEFVVTLVLKISDITAEPVAQKNDISFSGKKILLVEDNELNQEIAQTILEDAGFTVTVVGDGVEAVENMKNSESDTYDMILMDIQMPIMNGYDATRHIRALEDDKKANIPIIAMTANAFDEDRRAAFDAGMNGHLAKPIEIAKLLDTINEIMYCKFDMNE